MARTHLQQYRELGANVVAVAATSDPTPFVERHDLEATAHTSVADLCESSEVDCLSICTPTDTHRELVECAADHGIDVLLEKPIAGTLADAAAIERAVSESEISLLVGHVLRFDPGYERARDVVETDGIGAPGVARARRLSPFPDWGSGDWYADRERSGGLFLDLSIHDLDYLRSLWGPVERVFARRTAGEKFEHGFATLRFENGAVGYVEASWAQPEARKLTSELELAGDGGVVELSSDDHRPVREFTDDEVRVERPVSADGYRREVEHFLACVESGERPAVTVDEATTALRLALAARESAAAGDQSRPRRWTNDDAARHPLCGSRPHRQLRTPAL
ncbi:Gfo/Idh/MocA family protein [Haladaptatus sp. GCM10025707]|uniref:Gfo/Idh/MocA family protein n=1 Tax=Haladaptatus sp. GCM10025707 TaxID=3252658 RepID=UPI0036F270BD